MFFSKWRGYFGELKKCKGIGGEIAETDGISGSSIVKARIH